MKLEKYCISNEEYYNSTTFVSYVLTRKCAAGCWYCHWNGCDVLPGIVDFKKVIQFIDAQDTPNVHFTFYGGEPTNHPSLVKYMDMLNDKYGDRLKMYLITNGLKSKKIFEGMAKFTNLKVTFSYHSDVVPVLEEWLEKVSVLPDANIRLMMTQYNKMQIYNLWEKIHNRFETYISPIEQLNEKCNMDCEPITPVEDVQVIAKDGTRDDANYFKYHNFKHMMCSSGFVIRENGDVLRCWEDIHGTSVLNIMKDSIVKIDRWHLCVHPRCTCEQRFPKVSMRSYNEVVIKRKIFG